MSDNSSHLSGPAKVLGDATEQRMRANIELMNALQGFDVVIVCCSSENQAKYWRQRLDKGKGSIVGSATLVLGVFEDWPGGAGNALGTLYAYQNAARLAQQDYGVDLDDALRKGTMSVGLYHTAGKGTRLAPLPGSENNNKPGVKVPATVVIDGKAVPVTILESVIKQTGSYASCRKGRLSVFWGDQVFIPTAPCSVTPKYHADILCSLGPMMNEAEWREKGMDKYGLIAQAAHGGAAQVEKVDHATAVTLLSSLGEIESVGASLGSFSVSHALLEALLSEFAGELKAKVGKLDSDPHLWMPMTLVESAYLHLMQQKGVAAKTASEQYHRIAAMVARFNAVPSNASLGLFGPVDVGEDVLWWDYGQLLLYQKNTLRLTDDSTEARLMKLFYGIAGAESRPGVDAASCVAGVSDLLEAEVRRSVLVNVRCHDLSATDAILINVTAKRVVAPRGCILYNIIDSSEAGIVMAEGEVRVGVFSADSSQTVIRSATSIDGGQSWDKVVQANALSFEQLYNANAEADPSALEQVMSRMHEAAWEAANTGAGDVSSGSKRKL